MPIGTRRAAAHKAVKARRWRPPPLYIKQILKWADEHHEQTAKWPRKDSGRVRGTLEENWQRIDAALRVGLRGLPGDDSLARVLARFRGVRNRKALPPYTVEQILHWADRHFARHGKFPGGHSGPIADAPGETWTAVEMALCHGTRGLPGGSSLAKLLAQHRGRRNSGELQPFKTHQILQWADDHYERTGMWPTGSSGQIFNAPGETWGAVDRALRTGLRGMRGGTSLARLLHRRRGVPMKLRRKAPLSIDQILAWADDYHERTGQWPNEKSGKITAAPGETWCKVQIALKLGRRGLPGKTSLAKLLARHRGVRNVQDLPDLTIKRVLAWADAHFERHGAWPGKTSGSIENAPGETWNAITLALRRGMRGLPGGLSLARLLADRRGVRNHGDLPTFSQARILAWADAHHRRTGMWPQSSSGKIAEAPDETWANVDRALHRGLRGMRGGSSLARLLKRHRGVLPKQRRKPRLTIDMILQWGDEYYRAHGHWPTPVSGTIHAAHKETWATVHAALRDAARGLPAGLSLGKLWAKHRGVRNIHSIARFTPAQILRWADAHYDRTGCWPQVRSGPIPESTGDNWLSVENALRLGLRGLPGGSSLKRFLDKHRRSGTKQSPRVKSRRATRPARRSG